MAREVQGILEFGEFRFDGDEARLTQLGTPVPLPPKVFDLLAYLLSNPGRLIEKEELLKALWPNSFVEESNLTVNIAALRRVLGSQADGTPWIETVPKRGYRFLGAVSRPTSAAPLIEAPLRRAPAKTQSKYWTGVAIAVVVAVATYFWLHDSKGSSAPGKSQSIAVLPFQDLAADNGEPHFGLGMTDALLTRLGVLRDLTVRSMETVRKYNGIDPLEAGKRLNVETVLTGSVQRVDKHIRVTARLLRVQDARALWADKYDEPFTNIFAVQDAIAEKLASVLALRLTSEEQERMLRRYTENSEAYRLFELGRYEWFTDVPMAMEYYRRSIREDPRYALPYVELANNYLVLSGDGGGAFEKYAPLGREAAAKSLALAPDLAEAHVATADIKRGIDWDFAGAVKELDIAARLNPGSAKAHSSRSVLLAMQGELVAAISEARLAMSLDPFNGQLAVDLGWMLYCNHEYEAALAWLDEFKRRDARPHTDWDRFFCYLKLHRVPEAIAIMEAEHKAHSTSLPVRAALAHAYVLAEKSREAADVLKTLPADWGPYQRAVIEIAQHDQVAALAHLEQALEQHSMWIKWIKVDPDLEPVRADPRYAKMVAKVGLVP